MSDKPKKKVYSNEHPKYKNSKSYSEAEILAKNKKLEWNYKIKEHVKDIDSGKIIFKMPILSGENKKNIKYHIKKLDKEDMNKRLKVLKSKQLGTYSTDT